jgi:hypothetical protein
MNRRKEFIQTTGIDSRPLQNLIHYPHSIVAVEAEKTIYVITEQKEQTCEDAYGDFRVLCITRKQFASLVTQKHHPLYTEPIVLYGAERFYELLAGLELTLAQMYSPLVIA